MKEKQLANLFKLCLEINGAVHTPVEVSFSFSGQDGKTCVEVYKNSAFSGDPDVRFEFYTYENETCENAAAYLRMLIMGEAVVV